MLDSLRINAEVYAIERAEARRRIDELADMLDLHKHLTQPVRKLSLGERMKAELLAALLHRPAVLFLDEPTLGLDVNAQSSVRDFLRQYNRQHRATVLLTSHYMADITALCPRVLVIHEGSLMYDGSLTQIVQRLSPFRQVRVELGTPPDGRDFSQYGEVESVEGRVVRLIVQRETLTAAIARLMAELDVTDLTVSDPPVEDVIGRLFKQGALA
jgi:ABC-2 type transport system ATP-binding protein